MPHRRWLALLVILAADVMDLLDGSVLNVALPAIRADLGAGNTALQWISAGYTLAFAVVLITGARLGDIHRRKRIFQIGLAAFVVASLLCALAPSAGALVATRLLQGAAAAIMMPQVLGIIRTSFPPKEMAAAFGLVGPIMGLTAALGPAVGGILVDADLFGTGWRAVFLVNLPIGLIALACTSRLVRESRAPHPVRLDLVGMLLLSVAVALVFHPLVQGTDFVRMAAALPVLGLFIAHQRRGEGSPLLELT
ncbi:MFS transporter, partial [Kitasatospora nipponensis]|uniref:MFS transporter n=1 Tax=Kitasatospora nipponensis TaxID=258049 RepID=UPI0031CDDF32